MRAVLYCSYLESTLNMVLLSMRLTVAHAGLNSYKYPVEGVFVVYDTRRKGPMATSSWF